MEGGKRRGGRRERGETKVRLGTSRGWEGGGVGDERKKMKEKREMLYM